MSRTHFSPLALLLVSLLAAALVSPCALAAVGYPNPYPNPSLIARDGSDAAAVVKLSDVSYGGWGSRALSFDEPHAPNGTVFEVYLQRILPYAAADTDAILIATVTKGDSNPGPFSVTADTLQTLSTYEWYVVSEESGESEHWFFETPMEEPVDGSQRVGTMVRFIWDRYGPYQPVDGWVKEKMLLIRQYDGGTDEDWVLYDNSGAKSLNSAAVVKTWDGTATGGYRDRATLHEFWWLDSGYARLIPGSYYKWRILYCDKDGNPLSADVNGDGEADSYAWADGGYDSTWEGWNFRTVNNAPYEYSSSVKSVIIYWESMYGDKARDPAEGDWTFRSIADSSSYHDYYSYYPWQSYSGFRQIQEDVHQPGVDTVVFSTEELVATYGGLHYDLTAQQALVPTVTQWPGWWTVDRVTKADHTGFSDYPPGTSEQDRYEEWVGLAIRTWLQDACNRDAWEPYNDYAWLSNLEHVLLIGDADRVAPSFYYDDTSWGGDRWIPTDFFYSTQDTASEVKIAPRYQVSRIPVRSKNTPSVDEDGADYDPPVPVLRKFEDYCTALGDGSGKAAAYDEWFGRAMVVGGASQYSRWFPFYPAIAKYLLTQRIKTGGSSYRDTFSGLGVRKFDIFGEAGGPEALTTTNILPHLLNPSATEDVPGFIYMLTRGDGYDYSFWMDNAYYDAGIRFYLWPDSEYDSDKYIGAEMFSFAYDGTVPQRPFLISPAADAGRFDNAIHNANYDTVPYSIGEAGTLALGGPIGMLGFTSTYYDTTINYQRTFDEGDLSVTWTGGVDEPEGYSYESMAHGVTVDYPQNSTTSQIVLGKVELVCDFANEYAETNMPTLGGLFNNAMADYLARHSEALLADEKRVTTTVFGATLLGDAAILLPTRERPHQDHKRPVVTDVNPRVPTTADPTLPSYNTQDIPVHVVPHMDEYDPSFGVNVTLRIETDAPNVRVRVMTPFKMNQYNEVGYWNDTSEEYWTWDHSQDREVRATSIGQASYTFTAKAPSIYLAVVQAQNPNWQDGGDEDWRWLQERWIYIQAVNAFQRSSDSQTNILVVDDDQHDRYHLGGDYWDDVEEWYVHPAIDDAGYDIDPIYYSHEPALSVLNKQLGPDIGADSKYKYQFWTTNAYHTLKPNAEEMRQAQRYMGDITQGGLNSFLTSKGVVVYFSGDESWLSPNGYLFPREKMEVNDVKFLTNYVNAGGRLLLSNQNLVSDAHVPFVAPFQHDILGAVSRTEDTDYTNMDGLQDGTMSEQITDLNIAGGSGNDAGLNNATWTGEVDPNGTEAKTLFTWSDAFGPGETTGSKSSGISNRILATGGRTIYFTWPFEAIYTLGTVDPGSTGRANVMRQAIDWLRSVPKAAGPTPEDLAVNIPRDQTLSWSIVPEAAGYRLYLGTDQATLTTDPDNLHDNVSRDNPRFKPAVDLQLNTRYFWRVDTKNVDDYTTGDVWSFTTLDVPPPAMTPTPLDNSEDIPPDQTLSWYQDPLVDTYDLYIWEEGAEFIVPQMGLTSATFVPSRMFNPNQKYTWRVDTNNSVGTTEGPVWTFYSITPPDPPGNPPNPVDGANPVATNQKLSWPTCPRAESYDIFIWTAAGNPPGEPGPDLPFDPTTPAADSTFSKWSGHSTTNSYVPGELPIDTVMYWQVRPVNYAGRQNGLDKDNNDTGLLLTWSFTTGDTVADPSAPARPIYPTNGAVGVETRPTLVWERGQGADVYDVYFAIGSAQLQPIAQDVEQPECPAPGATTIGQLYKWRVIAKNSEGVTASGAIWSFTVGHAAKVTGMVPADTATGVSVDVTFNWDDANGAHSYDFYLWKMVAGQPVVVVAPDNVVPSQYKWATALEPLTTYQWRVDSVSAGGVDKTTGDVYTFTTGVAAGMADVVTGMSPADKATAIPVDVVLNWDDARGAVRYNVYMASNGSKSLGAGTTTLPLVATVTESRYTPSRLLDALTTYRWRVDSVPVNQEVQVSTGPEYTFTTTTADGLPGAVTRMAPRNGGTGIRTDTALTWAVGPGALTYDLFLGAGALPGTATATGLAGATTSYQPAAALALNTTYYWMVRSVNDLGHTDSAIFTFTTTDGTTPPPDTGGGGGGGGCFIATSAFESAKPAPGDVVESNFTGLYSITPERLAELNDIRGLRDSVLMPLSVGRDFSAWYYAVGPHAADAIRHNEPAKAVVRKVLLNPLSQLSRKVSE